jgi:hypothetical protein
MTELDIGYARVSTRCAGPQRAARRARRPGRRARAHLRRPRPDRDQPRAAGTTPGVGRVSTVLGWLSRVDIVRVPPGQHRLAGDIRLGPVGSRMQWLPAGPPPASSRNAAVSNLATDVAVSAVSDLEHRVGDGGRTGARGEARRSVTAGGDRDDLGAPGDASGGTDRARGPLGGRPRLEFWRMACRWSSRRRRATRTNTRPKSSTTVGMSLRRPRAILPARVRRPRRHMSPCDHPHRWLGPGDRRGWGVRVESGTRRGHRRPAGLRTRRDRRRRPDRRAGPPERRDEARPWLAGSPGRRDVDVLRRDAAAAGARPRRGAARAKRLAGLATRAEAATPSSGSGGQHRPASSPLCRSAVG